VPSIASIGSPRRRAPSLSRTVTGCSPSGLGRSWNGPTQPSRRRRLAQSYEYPAKNSADGRRPSYVTKYRHCPRSMSCSSVLIFNLRSRWLCGLEVRHAISARRWERSRLNHRAQTPSAWYLSPRERRRKSGRDFSAALVAEIALPPLCQTVRNWPWRAGTRRDQVVGSAERARPHCGPLAIRLPAPPLYFRLLRPDLLPHRSCPAARPVRCSRSADRAASPRRARSPDPDARSASSSGSCCGRGAPAPL